MSWNCRGSGGTTVSTLSRYLRCTGAQIAFISETRCGFSQSVQRIDKLSLCNYVVMLSQGKSSGLRLFWGKEVQVNVLEVTTNLIAAEITEKGGSDTWLLLAVYGDPNRTDNPILWDQLGYYIEQEHRQVLLMGDFNAIASSLEKEGGVPQLSRSNRAFNSWIHSSGLIDLGHHGPPYTWSNKQRGSANIVERLDRALATIQWTLRYPETAVFHLPRFQSDHLPILIRTKPRRCQNKPNFDAKISGV